MISTLRSQFAIALVVLLFCILCLAFVLFWGANRTEYYCSLGKFAYAELEGHLNFALQAYRHFFTELLVLSGAATNEDVVQSRSNLYTALEQLEKLTQTEVEAAREEKNEEERVEETEELQYLAAIRSLLNQTQTAFNAIKALQGENRQWEANRLLVEFFDNTTGEQFRRLIDDAISDEREELAMLLGLQSRLARDQIVIATVVSTFSVIFTMGIGLVLFQSISRPIKALVKGTDKIARGDLGYSITLNKPRELANLAAGFNRMARDLQRQQTNLLRARSELERKVLERTEELAVANQEMQHLYGEHMRFFADISHELRTPLTIIRGEGEVTLRGPDKPPNEYKTALQRIVDLTDQLGRLVDELLFLARSDAARARIDFTMLALDQVLADVQGVTTSLAQEKNLKVSLQMGGANILVKGDRGRLTQLFVILIDNACRYSKPDSEIAVRLETDGDSAVITIEDRGIGIDGSEIEHIFERFFRGEEARLMVPGGIGLGLPLAKSIVDAHHGKISVSSERGVGTTVSVRLPLTTVR